MQDNSLSGLVWAGREPAKRDTSMAFGCGIPPGLSQRAAKQQLGRLLCLFNICPSFRACPSAEGSPVTSQLHAPEMACPRGVHLMPLLSHQRLPSPLRYVVCARQPWLASRLFPSLLHSHPRLFPLLFHPRIPYFSSCALLSTAAPSNSQHWSGAGSHSTQG